MGDELVHSNNTCSDGDITRIVTEYRRADIGRYLLPQLTFHWVHSRRLRGRDHDSVERYNTNNNCDGITQE